ncbi:MAG: DsbA family protein [Pseudomonadota bacterium]
MSEPSKVPHLVYYADPMCPWCWGFAPVLNRILLAYAPRLGLRMVMGGLSPGVTEPLDEYGHGVLLGRWRQIAGRTGRPLDTAILDRPGFVYDTEPASRAVVAARLARTDLALPVFNRVQRAFFEEGLDTTRDATLAPLLADAGLGASALAVLTAPETRAATAADFAATVAAGISGFPYLVAVDARGRRAPIAPGYTRFTNAQRILDQWLAEAASG